MNCVKEMDPNITWAHRTYRIHFRMWKYYATRDVTISGNAHTMDPEDLCESLAESLPQENEDDVYFTPVLELMDTDGNNLKWEPEDHRFAGKHMAKIVVGIELIRIEPFNPKLKKNGG